MSTKATANLRTSPPGSEELTARALADEDMSILEYSEGVLNARIRAPGPRLVPVHKRMIFSGVARRAVVRFGQAPAHLRVAVAARGAGIV